MSPYSYSEEDISHLIKLVGRQMETDQYYSDQNQRVYRERYHHRLRSIIEKVVRDYFGKKIPEAIARLRAHFGV